MFDLVTFTNVDAWVSAMKSRFRHYSSSIRERLLKKHYLIKLKVINE